MFVAGLGREVKEASRQALTLTAIISAGVVSMASAFQSHP